MPSVPHNTPTIPTIVRERSYEAQLEEIKQSHPRIVDVDEAIDWILAKNPQYGTPVASNAFVLKTTSHGNIPSFWVLYIYIEAAQQILLLAIKPVEVGLE
jgi:hypothetical protein